MIRVDKSARKKAEYTFPPKIQTYLLKMDGLEDNHFFLEWNGFKGDILIFGEVNTKTNKANTFNQDNKVAMSQQAPPPCHENYQVTSTTEQ